MPSLSPNGGCQGDPHFKTWRGQVLRLPRECDPFFKERQVRVRFNIAHYPHEVWWWILAYIASAALRIGTDLLEVESQSLLAERCVER
jgi:hypothetical protein